MDIFPKSGTIYTFTKSDGTKIDIPIEQTPDDLSFLMGKIPHNKSIPIPPKVEPKKPVETFQKIEFEKPNKPIENLDPKPAEIQSDPRSQLSKIATTPVKPKPINPFLRPNPFGPSNFGKPSPFGKSPFPNYNPINPFNTKTMNGTPNRSPLSTPKPFDLPDDDLEPDFTDEPDSFTKLEEVEKAPHVASLNSQKQMETAMPNRPSIPPATNLPKPIQPFVSNNKTENVAKNPNYPNQTNESNTFKKPVSPIPHPVNPIPDHANIAVTVNPKTANNNQSNVNQNNAKKPWFQGQNRPPTGQSWYRNENRPVLKKPMRKPFNWQKRTGIALVILSTLGLLAPLTQKFRLETAYNLGIAKHAIASQINPVKPLPPSTPVIFNPLVAPDGTKITPVNTTFSIIVPKIGINSPVLEGVNPADTKEYNDALKKAVAHASTSFTPDQNGTVYLFSHSTNYDWFVKDLNAVFYLLKNLEIGDFIVLYYHGQQYTYKLTNTQIVKPTNVAYLVPEEGRKSLILQTCWPPGSTSERLLIFADLIEEHSESI
jgi:LPXTG-site transpeptidase (sortase) family protein